MQFHYKAVTGPPGIPPTKLPTSTTKITRAYQDPARPSLVLTESSSPEVSGACRGG